MRRTMIFVSAGMVSLALIVFAQKRTSIQSPATSATSGSQMFHAYCADCHGRDAKGNGPLLAVLKVAPPDLTTLTKRNGGKFPGKKVSATIQGQSGKPAHGSREMPAWGPIFRKMAKGHDGEPELRIKTLTSYIASLQAH